MIIRELVDTLYTTLRDCEIVYVALVGSDPCHKLKISLTAFE